jgi:hypothetical protein
MLGDRICQTQCNNRACAYDSIVSTANGGVQYDCTPDQISTPCLVAEAQSADSLRESPGASTSTLVPVAFQLAMSPGTRLRALSPPFPQLRSAQPVSHISHTWQAAFRSTATSTRWSVAPSTALRALSPWPCHYAPLSHPRRARCRLTVCMRHVASGVLQMWHQELDYKLQWSDNRLWTAHCAGALAPRLSALGTGVLADAAKPEPSHTTPSRVPSAPPPVLLM